MTQLSRGRCCLEAEVAIYGGLVWNLERNSDYAGPFTTLFVDLAVIQGIQLSFFWSSGTIPFTGDTWGLSVGYTPVGAAAAVSVAQTFYWHEIKFR